MDYVTPEEMRMEEERAASRGMGVEILMENAGAAVAETITERYGGVLSEDGRVVVVCGTGNNGGDGLVAARYLCTEVPVRVIVLARDPSLIRTPESRLNFDRLASQPVEVALAGDVDALSGRAAWISEATIIVDAILGTGVKGDLREPMATAIRLINESKAITVAVDLPSGLDPGSGAVGSGGAVRAEITVALHRPKVGLRGREEFTGEVVVVPIGISTAA